MIIIAKILFFETKSHLVVIDSHLCYEKFRVQFQSLVRHWLSIMAMAIEQDTRMSDYKLLSCQLFLLKRFKEIVDYEIF